MGVDSTALLLRWIEEPECRDFDLEQLVVLTAQTGDEFKDTQRLVETHMLPLLREFRIRYVQVARAGSSQSDGVAVLDDSREPTCAFIDGAYKLSQELQCHGTVPQVATGQRRCTHKSKGFPLTRWTDQEYGARAIRKVIGYNADERSRAERSEGYSTDTRPIEYPLVEWGWGREQCEAYVLRMTGEVWRKSLCVMCPFAAGKPDVLERYRQFPDAAAQALFLEHVSLAINPLAPLYGRRSLRSVIEHDGNATALRLLEERLDAEPWAVYRVRRIVWAKGRADRCTERLQDGTRDEITTEVIRRGGVFDGNAPRLYVRRREKTYPTVEEMIVAAPGVVEEKSRGSFAADWERLTGKAVWDD